MKVYLVGGAVRDQLLGLEPKERDWVVTGASEQQMLDAGYLPVHGGFPVFHHPQTGEEYALARTETKVGPGYHGFQMSFGPEVSLQQDLARRDLTINAIAQDADGNLIDPFSGQDDLDDGMLRHVTPAFQEDPVRVLRVARFAAKLGCWGFRVAHGTHGLMKKMSASSDFRALSKERFWLEWQKAMTTDQPWRFFEVLHRCGALESLLPPLAESMGSAEGHLGHVDMPALAALMAVAKQDCDPAIRTLAVLLPLAQHESSVSELKRWLPLDKRLSSQLEAGRLLLALCRKQIESTEQQLPIVTAWCRLDESSKGLLAIALSPLCPDGFGPMQALLQRAESALKSIDAAEFRAQGLAGAELGAAIKQAQLQALQEVLKS